MNNGTSNYQIRAEATPNPQTLRFSSNQPLTENPSEYKSVKETANSPLARKLFGFPWTAGVFIGRDFVTVTKRDWVDWETLAEPLTGLIQEHLDRGEGVIRTESSKASAQHGPAAPSANHDSADVQTILRILNEEIRPAVAMDGGDITFHSFENGIVSLYMQGSCAGCPSSTMTLKSGIETRLKQEIPSIIEVVSVN